MDYFLFFLVAVCALAGAYVFWILAKRQDTDYTESGLRKKRLRETNKSRRPMLIALELRNRQERMKPECESTESLKAYLENDGVASEEISIAFDILKSGVLEEDGLFR